MVTQCSSLKKSKDEFKFNMFDFKIVAKAKESKARAGLLQTAHGAVETPVFMPVGTLGTVRSLSPEELLDAGAQIILGNTYHLYLRPGCDVISLFAGLHRFMNWDRPILTDSAWSAQGRFGQHLFWKDT